MAGAIEFIDEPGGPDGDGAPPASPTRRSKTRLLALAAAVLAAGSIFALTRPATTPRAAAPATSAQRSAPVQPETDAPDHALATPSASVTGRCGAAPFCSVDLNVPAAVTAALQRQVRQLSGLRVESALVQSLATGSSYLADRVISIENPSTLLKISVHRLTGPAPQPEAAALGVLQVRVLTDAFVIDALSYPTGRGVLPRSRLLALAGDPRLELL